MRRIALTVSAFILVAVVVVAAQPPVPPSAPGTFPLVPPKPSGDPVPPAPPAAPPAFGNPPPVRSVAPPAPADVPLSRFLQLTDFPVTTQESVNGALRGATWITKMHQPHGRFYYGYNPTLRQTMAGDHDLKQARTTLAVAQSARFSGDKNQAAVAGQTILVLLASTKAAAGDPNCRVPVQMSLTCNRVAFAALVAMAIYEAPNASDKDTDDAERLCEFIRRQLRADGSVHYTDGPTDVPTQIDPAGVNEYPGLALHALALSNRVRPAEWKKEAVKKGVGHYSELFRTKPHPVLAATVVPAATELYLQTKLNEMAGAAFEMTDWLCALQVPVTDPRIPQWAGGFRTVANGHSTDAPAGAAETGMYVQCLSCAYQLNRFTPDLNRERKYKAAVVAAAQFLCGLQFTEANTAHFESTFRVSRLIGGFYLSPTDGNLRTDATACAVTGLLSYLSSGAEHN